jgi:RNA polymerase sigma-70 factor (ECF subfamily)
MTLPPSTDAIWTLLGADLRRFIRRRVADDHAADDLLQETYLRIHRSLATLQGTDRLAAWVHQIARNVIRDHYRRGRGETVALGDAEPALCEDRRSPMRQGVGEWLDELIRQLPETYREAVRLSEREGLSQSEAAQRLGLSLSAAKARIRRGRAMLKEALEQCCFFHFDQRGNLMDCDPKPDRTVCRSCDEEEYRESPCRE